jgi:pimeloyl-ACP methyl ester carboxylesterase
MFKRILLILLMSILALAALFYFRPVAVMRGVQGALLALTGIESKYTRVGSYRVHYLVGGKGPPLVLLHGLASRAQEWAPVLRDLTREHRVYAVDLLGFGDSDAPDIDYSISTQAGMVAGLLDALNVQQTDVLGLSMGGWIALKFAADHPARVRRLVLADSGGLTFGTKLTERALTPQTLEDFQKFAAQNSDRKLPDFVARDILRQSQPRLWVIRRAAKTLLSFQDALDGKLHSVRMPVLLLWGKADKLIPFEVATRMQREMPQARIVGLEGCSHLVFWDCRDRALPPVLEFLH